MIRTLLAALLAMAPAVAAQQRVLSLGGATTEIVYALGAGPALVGADSTSSFPVAAAALPKLGYVRALSAEGMLSLTPDLVLAAAEAGPPAVLDQVVAAGLRVVRLPEGPTPAGLLDRIRVVGAALDRSEAAARLAADVQTNLARVRDSLAAATSRPRVLFLMRAGRGAPLAAGRDTAADAMISLAGGQNAVTGFTGYKPLSPEAVLVAAPDTVLIFSDTADALGGADAVLALPELALTPAAKAHRLVAMDGLYLLGFGPRLPNAVHDLAAALHPELHLAPLPAGAGSTP